MPERSSATATVVTPTPPRYAEQLASYFGRRCDAVQETVGLRIVLGGGSCLVTPREDVLDLRVSGPPSQRSSA